MMTDGGLPDLGRTGTCGLQKPSRLGRLGRSCHMVLSHCNLGHTGLCGLQEVRKMFAFLCIVSNDTPVLDMRPRVSCLQDAHKAP